MSHKTLKKHSKFRITLIIGMSISMLLSQFPPFPFLGIPGGVQDAKAVIAYEQEGFRFRADDGSETTATWLAAQDTNISRAKNTNTRLRMLVNTTDDTPSNRYQLEYKLSTDGTYSRVIPQVTTPVIENSSSQSYTSDTSFTLSHTVYTGQKLAVLVHSFGAGTIPTFSATFNSDTMTSAGSTAFSEGGRAYVTEIFYMNTPNIGTFNVVISSTASVPTVISAHSLIGFSGTIGDIGSSTTGCSAVVDTIQANSLILTASTQRSTTTPPNMSPVGSNSELYELNSGATNSNVVGAGYSLVTTSTGSYTGGSTCSATVGDSAFAAEFRFDTTQQPIYLALSGNITASGANTTAQLTAPSGKTTGDFVAGRIQDDENPADAINITIDDYTELEWSLIATDATSDGDVYQFRVTVAGTAFDTYTVIPEWTIGTGATPTPTPPPDPVSITQNDWRIYVNNNAIDPDDPWPGGGAIDLVENEPLNALPVQNRAVSNGDVLRLRMNVTISDNNLAASSTGFILAYAEAADCTTVSSWTDVDDQGGGGAWRFFNSSVTDGVTISTLRLSVSDILGRVSESNPTGTNPNTVNAGQDLEWDWVVQYNGETEANTYCFRMEYDDGSPLDDYNADSYPQVDTMPGVSDLMRHGNFYAAGVEKGFYWSGIPFEAPIVANAASINATSAPITITSFTVANNPNRILVCGTAVRDGVSVTSITWNGGGESFTKIDHNMPGADVRTELWYLLNPTATTANIVFNFSGSTNVMGGCVSVFNAAQIAPTGSAKADALNSTPTVNVATSSGDLVIDIVGDQAGNSDGGLLADSPQIAQWRIQAQHHDGGMSTKEATSTSTTMSWTNSEMDIWSMIAVPIKRY